MTILLQTASAGMQQSNSSQGWLSWMPVAALIVSLITLATIFIFRWRDTRTRLIITYSVGQPENPTDIVSIPEDERPREPALYIKIFNGSKMSVGLNNAFMELKAGTVTYERLGNFHTEDVITSLKQPGDHWYVYQRMYELGQFLRDRGCGGTTRF